MGRARSVGTLGVAAGAGFGLLSLNRPNALLCVAAIARSVSSRRFSSRAAADTPPSYSFEEILFELFVRRGISRGNGTSSSRSPSRGT